MDISDFPIGCKVVPLNEKEAYNMHVGANTIGVVVYHDTNELWLHIKWEQKEDREIGHWHFSRFRLASAENEKKDPEIAKNLKFLNTDGRVTCAVCGCQLKDPGMGITYRYCPKCEP